MSDKELDEQWERIQENLAELKRGIQFLRILNEIEKGDTK